MGQTKAKQGANRNRGNRIKLVVSKPPEPPPVFEFIGEVKPEDPAIGAISRLGCKDALKGSHPRFRPASRAGKKEMGARKQKAGKGRWPVDLVGGYPGVLILQVWEGAGLEPYGLADRDLVIIGIDDPEESAPAFASINDKAVIGWYGSNPDGTISIRPFVQGTPELTAPRRQVQVVCVLRAIARRRSKWLDRAEG